MLVLISLPNHLTYLTSVVVVLCLTLTYTAAGGLMFCLGLMQGVWIQEINITTSDASLINSVTFAITLFKTHFCLIYC